MSLCHFQVTSPFCSEWEEFKKMYRMRVGLKRLLFSSYQGSMGNRAAAVLKKFDRKNRSYIQRLGYYLLRHTIG